jgi:hypothetical protein
MPGMLCNYETAAAAACHEAVSRLAIKGAGQLTGTSVQQPLYKHLPQLSHHISDAADSTTRILLYF